MDLQLLTNCHEYLTLYLVLPCLFFLGIYLTFKLKALPFLNLKHSFSCLLKSRSDQEGNISHYEAIAGVLAGNFGTGNISGMAVALAAGGPGALVWMWVMAFFGAIVQYGSCLLSVEYRQLNRSGEYVGGPMYYLSEGMQAKKTARLFSFFAILASLTVGNFAQVNSVILPLKELSFDPFLSSLVLMAGVGIVILGGVKRFAQVASAIVPVMALIYLGTAFIILGLHINQIMPSLKLMFEAAFGFSSALGGLFGFSVFKAVSTGFGRGVFATDAGTGMGPIIQASAKTTNAVEDGMVALLAPFLVMIVCTVTGLVLIVTGAWQVAGLQSTNMCTYAFSEGLGSRIGHYIVFLSLLLFAYTTIVAWAYCGARCVEFLWGNEKAKYYQYGYLGLIPIGAFVQVEFVWLLADVSISLMMMTNLIGIFYLRKTILEKSQLFFGEDQNMLLKPLIEPKSVARRTDEG